MLFLTLVTLTTLFNGLTAQTVDQNGVTLAEKTLNFERLILNPFGLNSIVEPCSKLFDGDPKSGETTSAEWIRIVFHDFATADVAAGNGGLDASISFESDREENIGIHFVNSTITAFDQFFDVYSSMSDLIALGLADSFLSCDPGANFIKLRIGRKDATGPGPSGVPGPADSLAFAQAQFAKAGFNQQDMIQAVACGHSVGNVHRANFPEIVPQSVVNENNTDGAQPFDSTPFTFDNTGVNEYLSNTGLRGGPLVVGANQTTNSDFRIFNSDKNVTMRGLASPLNFQQKCFKIFERMLDTVPRGTVLSDPISVRPWILNEGHLDLSSTGAVTYSGQISSWSFSASPATASYEYVTVGGGNTGPKNSQSGTNIPRRGFGTVTQYNFADSFIDSKVVGIKLAGLATSTFPINQTLFILPSRSFISTINGGDPQYILRAALLTTTAPTATQLTATQYYRGSQKWSRASKLVTSTAILTKTGTLGPYTLFQGIITPPGGHPNARGHVDVKLGTTITSPKIEARLFAECTNSVLTSC